MTASVRVVGGALCLLVGLSLVGIGFVEATDTCQTGHEVEVNPVGAMNRSGTPVINYSSLSPDSQIIFRKSLKQMEGDEYTLHPRDRPADFRSPMVVKYQKSKYYVEFGRFQYCSPNYGSELILAGLLFGVFSGYLYRDKSV